MMLADPDYMMREARPQEIAHGLQVLIPDRQGAIFNGGEPVMRCTVGLGAESGFRRREIFMILVFVLVS